MLPERHIELPLSQSAVDCRFRRAGENGELNGMKCYSRPNHSVVWLRRIGYLLLAASLNVANAADITFVQVASTTNTSVSELSKSLRQGIEAAFDRLNRTHAANYDRVKLAMVDDEFNQAKAMATFKHLAEQPDVLGLIGCVGTPAQVALSTDSLLVRSNLTSIAPATGADVVLEPNFFPVRATYRAEVDRLLKQAASMSQKRVALIWWVCVRACHIDSPNEAGA